MKRLLTGLIILLSVHMLPALDQHSPAPLQNEQRVEHQYYTLSYNEAHEQANWVMYELTKEEVLGQTKRNDSFKADPTVSTGSASLADYRGSGYDRGHLAPAADMKMNSSSMSESFYMSNMSPQNPSFNRGIWKKLESTVRQWAVDNESIIVLTGPILTKSTYPTIGTNEVSVPEYYYKVIWDHTDPEIKMVGFILPNEKGTQPLQSYAVSVDEVEQISGIDFFHGLSDTTEDTLESTVNLSKWSFSEYSGASSTQVSSAPSPVQEQEAIGAYWINSSSNTRHNSGCRYYGNTKNGYYTNEKIGKPCGTCGG